MELLAGHNKAIREVEISKGECVSEGRTGPETEPMLRVSKNEEVASRSMRSQKRRKKTSKMLKWFYGIQGEICFQKQVDNYARCCRDMK